MVYAVPRGMYSFSYIEMSLTLQSKSDTSGPSPQSLANSAAGSSRVQKPKMKRSNSNVTPSIVQMAMTGDPSVLAQHANPLDISSQTTSEPSSNVPSLVSSSSSTPQISAVDRGPPVRTDSMQSTGFPATTGEDKPHLQLGMMGIGGYRTSSDIVGWSNAWPDVHAPLPQDQPEGETISDCCRPAVIPEESVISLPPPSCCAPRPADSYDSVRHAHQDALQVDHGQAVVPTSTNGLGSPHMNFSVNFVDAFSPPEGRYGQFTIDPAFDFFSQYESRHGCSTNGQISSHINGGGEQHDCHCGDGCMCLGCSQHPGNKTTQDYARYHNELASRGYNTQQPGMVSMPVYFQSSYPTRPSPYALPINPGAVPNLQQHQFPPSFQSPYNHTQGYGMPQGLPQQMGAPIQTSAPTNAMPPFNFQSPMAPSTPAPNSSFQSQTKFQTPSRPTYQDRSETQRPLTALNSVAEPTLANPTCPDGESATTHESPSTDQEDNASTLSPSSFYVQHFQIPGCDDVTGTCHCGDGCTCVGCLVHSGHRGESGVLNETSADTTRRLSEALHMNALRSTPDLHGFSLDGFQEGIHDTLFATSVPG